VDWLPSTLAVDSSCSESSDAVVYVVVLTVTAEVRDLDVGSGAALNRMPGRYISAAQASQQRRQDSSQDSVCMLFKSTPA